MWRQEAYLRGQDWLITCCTFRSKNPTNQSKEIFQSQKQMNKMKDILFKVQFRGKRGYGGPGLRTERWKVRKRAGGDKGVEPNWTCVPVYCLMNYFFFFFLKSREQNQVCSILRFFLPIGTIWLSAVLMWQKTFSLHHSYRNAHGDRLLLSSDLRQIIFFVFWSFFSQTLDSPLNTFISLQSQHMRL